jgi:hypothetical protein
MMITRVVIIKGGTERAISVDEWKQIGLTERITLLTDESVRFYAGETHLSAREALVALKSST